MSQVLKTFVSKLISGQTSQSFPHLYIVDKQTGPYRSIQEAIDAAEPQSLIKISEGFYEQRLVIKKPLRLEPKNMDSSSEKMGVVLLASSGIGVHINLPDQEEQCSMVGIKFSHTGSSESTLKNEIMEHEHLLNIFEQQQNIEQLENEFVNRMSYNKMENLMVLVEKGVLRAENCVFSLNYLVKSCNTTIPALWVERDGTLQLLRSEVKGHETKDTIGVVGRLGVVMMESSVVRGHKEGGVVLWGIKNNPSKVSKCIIEDNEVGVHVVGEEFRLKVYNNRIAGNKVGIKVGLAAEPQVNRNVIEENGEGMEIFSAFPTISLNKVERNSSNGIVCKAYKHFLCKAVIRRNVGIAGNGANGVLLEGERNHSQLLHNHMVGFNGEAGVRVEREAFPLISGNKIYKNSREGVLVVENSNALIEKNEIGWNVECNVAIGGANTHQSLLSENMISDSPGAGVQVVHSDNIKIVRNDVVRNQDGLILTRSKPVMLKNYVGENRGCGIACEDNSFPRLIENVVMRNGGVGLLGRQGSLEGEATVHSNVLASNQVDVGLTEYNCRLCEELEHANTIEKDIYYPEGLNCQIM